MDCGNLLTVEAKLNYRKFNWWHTQWAYAGVRDPEDTDFQIDKGYDDGKWVWTGDTSDVAGKIKAIPNLPTIVMASTKTTLKVASTVPVPSAEVGDTRRVPLQKAGDAVPMSPQPENTRERWNDYGIGLLLQGESESRRDGIPEGNPDRTSIPRWMGKRRKSPNQRRRHARRRNDA